MPKRPRTKKYRRTKLSRCPKCQKVTRLHQVRCKTCSLLLRA